MRFHVVFRSYAGENVKPRPPFYSKELCLLSLWRAWLASPVDGDLLFLNDGPMPEHRLDLMRDMGEVLPQLPSVGRMRSLRTAISLVDSRPWDPTDLVLFLEDHYLLLPETIVEIVDLWNRHPELTYFTPYDLPDRYPSSECAGGGRELLFASANRHWRTVESTTSTFGAPVGAVQMDAWVHFLALREPNGGLVQRTHGSIPAYDDRAAYLTLQGIPPFRRVSQLVVKLGSMSGIPEDRQPLWLRLKRVVTGWSYKPRLLVCPMPGLAAHLEEGWLPFAIDWEAAAAEVIQWAKDRGIDTIAAERSRSE